MCRFCCKSLFAQMITNFPSCRRGFRVNVGGTSSHSDELTGDFGNEPEAISIGDHGLSRLLAEKLSPRDLGLLQQNRHIADIRGMQHFVRYWTRADKHHGVLYEYTPFRCYLVPKEAQREIQRSCPAIVYYLRRSLYTRCFLYRPQPRLRSRGRRLVRSLARSIRTSVSS